MEGIFPGQHKVGLNLIVLSRAGHSCWMSSQVEDFSSRLCLAETLQAEERGVISKDRNKRGLSAAKCVSSSDTD